MTMRRLPVLSMLLAALLAPAAPALAQGREVLVLVEPGAKGVLRDESPYMATEAVLNHLGLIVRYHDLGDGVPTPDETAAARGVIVLAEGALTSDPAAYDRWLDAWLDSGRPLYLLGGPALLQAGADGRRAPDALWQGVLARLGMQSTAGSDDPRHVTALAGPHAAFECGFTPPPAFAPYRSTDAHNQAFLRERDENGTIADLGVAGPHGVFAASRDCLFEVNPLTYGLRWRVDPFWLFGGLKAPGEPALDTTTLDGRRLFYAHIDGDGFSNRAHMRGTPYAAEVIRDQVLEKTWLPTTASIIVREVCDHSKLEAIARSIFALPNVHAGSHTYSHPFDFEKGIVPHLGATSDSADEALNEPHKPLLPVHEVDDSIRYIQTLLPANKKVEAMLWSGEANPTLPYLARAAAMGVANLNGGDPVLDTRFPSYANLTPLAHRVGPYWQVFASCGNENLFTNLWTGPFDGQIKALALFRFTESPRRMLPVNLYYHYYSGERIAGLKTLQALYRWAEGQPLCHVTVAEYCRVVDGFFAGSVSPDGPGAWRVANAGDCRTLRFDDRPGGVDLLASTGVAGYNHANGSLYVHLSAPEARVVLTTAPPAVPYLSSASAPLASWRRGDRRLDAAFQGEAPITLRLAGFAPGQLVRVTGDFAGSLQADATGHLALSAPRGLEKLEVSW
ncbi:MAG TPA: hypothetical protein V6D47_22440 [Oscillatoriaceae cyanobacterium]